MKNKWNVKALHNLQNITETYTDDFISNGEGAKLAGKN